MLLRRIFAKKSIDTLLAEMAGESRLHRVLGPISLTALGVGCIIGAGIFVMTGRAAAETAGPAIMLSYTVAAIGCVLAALCYAEFAATAPVAGSAYTYAYATLGELCAWIIGWDLVLEYAMACACVAAAWAEYLNEFLLVVFNQRIPTWLSSDPFSTPGAWFNLPAVGIMIAITAILIFGIRESALTNAVLTLVKLSVVLFVIALGIGLVNKDRNNWFDVPHSDRLSGEHFAAPDVIKQYLQQRAGSDGKVSAQEVDALTAEFRTALRNPEIPRTGTLAELLPLVQEEAHKREAERWGVFGYLIKPATLAPIDERFRSNFAPYGISGIMLGAAIVFFAFIGFDSISTHSEEAINPQRDVPLAILLSLGVCTVLYVMVSAVITGMEPYYAIDTKAAVAAAFRKRAEVEQNSLLKWSSALIATGALAGLTSVLLVTFLSQARVFLAMARDRLLPHAIFGVVHPVWKTPHISTALTGAVICVVAAFTPISDLEKMVNIGTLFAFVVVCATVLILRIQRPEMDRPFRCPMVFLVAPAGILVNFTMMLFLPAMTWFRLFGWLAIGLVIYFCYGYWHSTLGGELAKELAREGVGPTDAPLRP